MTVARWRAIADVLAVQLAVHAFCDTHPESSPDPGCPYCADRAAYNQYLQAGGTDHRSAPQGKPIEVSAICARPEVTG
ncbi:hypothetical protein [Streptosporangium sp. V21-05]|uniref:hypothetical protein n=1 Tax=Streptosporangium sp. V21-05 TaxID=3446115 RepID=UPI003F5326AF